MTSSIVAASVSAICTYRLSLAQDLEFWSRNGITDVGVSVAKLEAAGWDPGIAALRQACDRGLTISNLIGLGNIRLDSPADWDTGRQRLLRAIDAAQQLGTELLILTTGPAGTLTWEQARVALQSVLEPVLLSARNARLRIALEHTHSLRADVGFVHSLRDAIDLSRTLDTSVCMEINACWAERNLEATIREGVDRIAVVQLSDYAIGTLTTPARLVPGDGDIPIARILTWLRSAGYEGPFDLELIGPAIEHEGYDNAIPRAISATRSLLAAAGFS